jgi:hypothetical protein
MGLSQQHMRLGLNAAQDSHGKRLERNQALRGEKGAWRDSRSFVKKRRSFGEDGIFTMTTGDFVIPAL